jgi:thiamine pyrophosphate-dependent acetolactate synthase large subunit-like protein
MSAHHRKPVLDRRKAAAAILVRRADALVVTGLGAPTWDTAAAGDSPLNFYTWGGMGCAAMVGLGLALAQPKRRVIVITGDGEMLMALGALATIAVQRPRNLSIIVMDNEHYGETGMQPTHTGLGTDIAGMAKAAGFSAAKTVYTTAELKTWIPKIYGAGPVFVDIKVTTERAPLVLPPRDGTLLKLRFREALLGKNG